MKLSNTKPDHSVSLFDSGASWHAEPSIAMAEFLASHSFRIGNRSQVELPENHQLAEGSQAVYAAMFEKFLRHLDARGRRVPSASEVDVDHFFGVVLAESSKETRSRYVRLLERTYAHLVVTGVCQTNPVGQWVRARGGANTKVDLSVASAPKFESVTSVEVARLQDWLLQCGRVLLGRGEWRQARDYCLASVSLGTGLRCTELLRLRIARVKHVPSNPSSQRFIFDIKRGDTVTTAKPHEAPAMQDCVDLMEEWWRVRNSGFMSPLADPSAEHIVIPGGLVFPGNEKGDALTPSTLYRSLKRVASAALMARRLHEGNRWVLETGAQGLRKAYVLASLGVSVEPGLLQLRLGHHHLKSVLRVLRKATKPGDQLVYTAPSQEKLPRQD